MADLGYPVPAVYFTCTDKTNLGGQLFNRIVDHTEPAETYHAGIGYRAILGMIGRQKLNVFDDIERDLGVLRQHL